MSASRTRNRVASLVVGLAMVGAGLFSPLTAHAQASGMLRGGGFALGYDTRVGALGAVNARYMLSEAFGIDAWLGFMWEPQNADRDTTIGGIMNPQDRFDLSTGVGVVYAWQVHERASINFVGRLLYAKVGSHRPHGDTANLGISVGIGPELFIFDRISIEVIFGFAMGMASGEVQDAMGNWKGWSAVTFQTFGDGISIVQGATFRIYL